MKKFFPQNNSLLDHYSHSPNRMKLLIVQFFLFVSHIFATSDKNWWKHTTIYDIHVMSFKDSNGDGNGDLAGITSKLDYFQDFGIPAIRLSSIFSSKEKISKYYGIDNFTDIHPDLGRMDDFDELIDEAKKRNIKIILDINFHHCHETHEWFQKSVERIKPYENYFIWKDPIYDQDSQIRKTPNTELTFLTETSVWKYVEKRGQFYLSTLKNLLPDLNLQNDELKKELKKVVEFWLDRGVSGFYIANPYYIFDDDENKSNTDFHEFLREIRESIDIYNTKENDYERILITDEESCGPYALDCFGNKNFPLVHLVLNRIIYRLIRGNNLYIRSFQRMINSYMQHTRDGAAYEWNV